MKKVLFLTPLAITALAGCAPKQDHIQAGQWEVVTQLTGFELPNATPEQQAQIRRQINVDQPQPPQCLTQAQTQTYLQDLRGTVPPNCRVTDEVYAGGVMRTTVTCPAQAGQPAVTLRMDGTFTATTLNATITEEATPPNGQGQMRRTQRLRARRIGDCPAQPPAPAMPALPPGAQPPAGL